jgi:hypothetical protein
MDASIGEHVWGPLAQHGTNDRPIVPGRTAGGPQPHGCHYGGAAPAAPRHDQAMVALLVWPVAPWAQNDGGPAVTSRANMRSASMRA